MTSTDDIRTADVPHDLDTTLADDGPAAEMDDTTTRDLATAFADALVTDPASVARRLAEHVVYLAPGRAASAGLHRGRHAVLAALTPPAEAGVVVENAEVTDVLVDGQRAFVMIAMRGSSRCGPFDFEVGLHLAVEGGSITGITEYSGDQYTSDALLGTSLEPNEPPPDLHPSAATTAPSPGPGRWRARLRQALRRS